jgi:membrane-bound ClpP family serine protease
MGLGGVIGAVLLILGFVALSVLPVNPGLRRSVSLSRS